MNNSKRTERNKKEAEIHLQKLHVSRDATDEQTVLGGVALVSQLLRGLGFQEAVDSRLKVFKIHQGYRESDHLLHLVNNLYVGGSGLDDLARLQADEQYKRMLGVDRVTDPTTGGDFLRRFQRSDINALKDAIWDVRKKAWSRAGKRLGRSVNVDLDNTFKEVYGNCSQGADFSYKKKFSYHPEVLSLAETGEWLDAINLPGNEVSGCKAAYLLRRSLPHLTEQFDQVCVRGDTKFGRTDVLKVAREHGASVCLCWAAHPTVQKLADELPQTAWKKLKRHTDRGQKTPAKSVRRRPNLRRKKARKRGYADKKLLGEEVAEFNYHPTCNKKKLPTGYRMIVIRKQIEVAGKTGLIDLYRYFFILTDLKDADPNNIVRRAYSRCNQENLIEQGKNGVSAFRMPTGRLLANDVWMVIGMLAQSIKSWLCLLALGLDKLNWEWKRFRLAFVYVVVRVIKGARQRHLRISAPPGQYEQLTNGLRRLGAVIH